MTRNQKIALVIGLLFLLYFFTRLINLSVLPIFNDESTYIRYGMHQLHEPDHKPYSLMIGKEPLMPWLYAVIGSMTGNLLLGARFVTIFMGALTLLGLGLFTRKIMGNRAAVVVSLLYIFAPYTLFFDRLALMDCAVSTVAIWSLYFTYNLYQENWKIRDIFFLSVVTGIGMWIKTSALFYLLLPLVSYGLLFLLQPKLRQQGSLSIKLFGTVLFFALLIFAPLFFSDLYPEHLKLLQQYTYPLLSVFTFPVNVWWNNFSELVQWLFFYLTPPLFLLAVGSVILFWKKKALWLVSLWLVIPLVYEVLYAKLFTARHALLLVIPLLLFAAYGWRYVYKTKKMFAYTLLAVILVWGSIYNITLLTDPQAYPMMYPGAAQSDAKEYVYGFSSGYGVLEAVQDLEIEANHNHIVVVFRNDHGNPEDAVVGYLAYTPNITLAPIYDAKDMPAIFSQVDKSMPVYFVSRGAYYAGVEKYFVRQKKFLKPNDTEFVGVELLKH